jgi:Putative Ig domain
MVLKLILATAAAATATSSPIPSASATASPTLSGTPSPSPSPSPSVIGTPTAHGTLILWLLIAGIIVAGVVIIFGRNLLESGKGGPAASLIRSWIAISLVIGLLIFCAAALLGNNTSLQSSLFGGLIASTGAAIAFYFSSKGADQARADILNAAATIGQGVTKPSAFSQIAPSDGKINTPYSYRIIADGFPAPTYGVVSGELPAGLIIDTDGTLHGTPKAAGSSTFAVAAANSGGFLVSPDLTITIAPAS